MKACSVEGCEDSQKATGLCSKHYRRQRAGNPTWRTCLVCGQSTEGRHVAQRCESHALEKRLEDERSRRRGQREKKESELNRRCSDCLTSIRGLHFNAVFCIPCRQRRETAREQARDRLWAKERLCRVCPAAITGAPRGQRYCSQDCRRTAKLDRKLAKPAHRRECKVCGLSIAGPPSSRRKYCALCSECNRDNCDAPRRSSIGFCGFHYSRWRNGTDMLKPFGDKNRYQIGTRHVRQGYAWIKIRHGRGGWKLEHHLVMVESLSRPLLPHENVHHINGIRDDNRLENLELWSTSQPSGQRVADKAEWAADFLQEYGLSVKGSFQLALAKRKG